MATDLRFTIHLDDSEFNKKIQAVRKQAKLFNSEISAAFNVMTNARQLNDVTKLTSALERLRTQAGAYTRERTQQLTEERTKVQETTTATKQQATVVERLTGLVTRYASIAGFGAFAKSVISITGEFEKQQAALRSIVQDTDGADALVEKLKILAVKSPFQYTDLVSYTKQLSAFSVPLDDLYDKTKMLADLSAGLGVDMFRLILAYGQVKSATYLRGQELRQFTEAGVPILDELAQKFSELEGRAVSAGEVFERVSRRAVSFKMVDEVLTNLTSEGGRFFEMQETLAETLAGRISNLKDSFQIMANEIGSANSGPLKNATEYLTNLMQNWRDSAKDLIALVAAYGLFRGVLAAVNAMRAVEAAQITAVTVQTRLLQRAQIALRNTMASLKGAAISNVFGLIATAVAAAAYGIYKLCTSMSDLERMTRIVDKSISEFNVKMDAEETRLRLTIDRLKMATQGTDDYAIARKQLMSQYGSYLSDMDKEALRLGKLEEVYTSLAEKIRETTQARYYETSYTNLSEEYEQKMGKLEKKARKRIDQLRLSEVDKQYVLDLIFGRQDFKNEVIPSDAKKIASTLLLTLPRYSDTGALIKEGRTFLDAVNEIRETYIEALNILSTSWGTSQAYSNPKPKILPEEWIQNLYSFLTTKGVDVSSAETALADLSKLGQNLNELWANPGDNASEWVTAVVQAYNNLQTRLTTLGEFAPQDSKSIKESMGIYEEAAKTLKFSLGKQTRSTVASTSQGVDSEKVKAEAMAAVSETQSKLEEQSIEATLTAMTSEINSMQEGYSKKQAQAALSFVKAMYENGQWGNEWENAIDYLNKLCEKSLPTKEQVSKEARKLINQYANESYNLWLAQNPMASEDEKNEELAKLKSLTTNDLPEKYKDILNAYTSANVVEYKAEQAKLLNDLLAKYQDYEKKRKAITEKYNEEEWKLHEAMQDNDKEAYNEYIDELNRQKQAALNKLRLEEDPDLGDIFRDANTLTADALDKAIKKARTLLIELGKTQDIDSFETVLKQYEELVDVYYNNGKRGGLLGLLGGYDANVGVDEFIAAIGEQIKAQRELNELKEKANEIEKETTKESNKAIEAAQVKLATTKEMTRQALVNFAANEVIEGLKDAANYLTEISEITGDDSLSVTADKLMLITTLISDSLAGLVIGGVLGGAIGGAIGAAVGVVVGMLTDVVQSLAAVGKFSAQLRVAAKEYADACKVLAVTFDEEEYESMFGTNALRQAADAYSTAQAAAEKLTRAVNALSSARVKVRKGTWFSSARYKDLLDYASGLGYSLYTDGEFDFDRAQEFLDAYGDLLPAATKEALQYAIDLQEAYEDAMEVVEEYWGDIFGDLADDLTSILVDSIENGTDAWTDFQEKGAEVIQSLAETMISTMLYEQFLEPYIDRLTEVFGTSDDINAVVANASMIIAEMFSGLEDSIEYAQALYTYMKEYSEALGYDWDTTSSDSLSSDISSVTEKTATLLASYINAIRADVSVQKGYLYTISGVLSEADLSWTPSMADHMAATEAYLANIQTAGQSTAEHTLALLQNLTRLMTTETGSTALRVAVQ